jgi:hypothetical protein
MLTEHNCYYNITTITTTDKHLVLWCIYALTCTVPIEPYSEEDEICYTPTVDIGSQRTRDITRDRSPPKRDQAPNATTNILKKLSHLLEMRPGI